MKINCGLQFQNLKGEVVNVVDEKGGKTPLTLGQVLADVALTPHKVKNGFRPLKGYELAQKFYANKEVDIDRADFIQLKELIENNEAYTTLIIAQAIKLLSEVKE